MARVRESEYSLYPRKLSDKTVWYYYVYDDKGNRQSGKSTGRFFTREKDRVKSRREAEAFCEELLKNNRLNLSSAPTLEQWISDMAFWDWTRSQFVRGVLARSSEDKPGITEGYCLKSAAITEKRILPYHGHKRIDMISPYDCEQLLFTWKKDFDFSHKTLNNWMYCYSTILGEYERIVKMQNPRSDYFNPWKIVKPLGTKNNKYGGLKTIEVQNILSLNGVNLNNRSERLYYYATKLAFLTGLRMGEITGLQSQDVKDIYNDDGNVRMSYLQISHQWHDGIKQRTLTKDKTTREIPLSAVMRDDLEQFISGDGCYLFSQDPNGRHPISNTMLRKWFYKRMEDCGISDYKVRHIVFHSTRRFFNTMLVRARVDSRTIQRFTGHDTEEMTAHYTDYLPEDLQEISRAQDQFLIESR